MAGSGLSAAVYADAAQIASAVVEEPMSGLSAKVTVDLADNWSVQYYPYAFYLYDEPFDPAEDGAGEFLAYGVLYSQESYDSIFEGLAEGEAEEKDGYVKRTIATGQVGYYAPVSEGLYIGVLVDPAQDTDAVFARVSYAVYESVQ